MENAGDVFVAIVTTIGVLGAAAIGALGEAIRRNARATRDAVGEPNGQGNVVQMCEQILAGQAGQDRRLATLEERSLANTNRLDGHARRLTALERGA